MTDDFDEFTRQNLVDLDELAGLYNRCKLRIGQRYWNDLVALTKKSTPQGYTAFDSRYQPTIENEYTCGWNRNVEIRGSETTAFVGFGCDSTQSIRECGWPFMNRTC